MLDSQGCIDASSLVNLQDRDGFLVGGVKMKNQQVIFQASFYS